MLAGTYDNKILSRIVQAIFEINLRVFERHICVSILARRLLGDYIG